MTAVSVWFVLGLFLDAFAHSTVPELETFFTPWHAVFSSGFAATGGWVLWTVWRNVEPERHGLAAVPVGYGMTMVALPVLLDIPLTIVVAGVGVDLLARRLRPTGERRTAFWVFAAAAPLLTWSLYLGVASAVVGWLPAVTELWTGIPVVTALVGWLLAALMSPTVLPVTVTAPERTGARAG